MTPQELKNSILQLAIQGKLPVHDLEGGGRRGWRRAVDSPPRLAVGGLPLSCRDSRCRFLMGKRHL